MPPTTEAPAAPIATDPAPPDPRADLAAARAELATSRELLDQARRERDIHRAAFDSGAIDLDAVAALAAKSLTSDPALDAPAAVANLKSAKPHLFRPRPAPPTRLTPSRASAMSPRPDDHAATPVAAAHRSASTGDRNSLLTYLRLRRLAAD